MRKLFILGAAIVVSLAMLMTACKKDEVNNNGNNNGNTENPGGGGSGSSGSGSGSGSYNNQEYPSTDNVIFRAVTDIDGNIYDAVQIGNQVWMAENLRTTRYADGTSIPLGTSTSTTTAYRYAPEPDHSNEENLVNLDRYGYLYNWPAVMHGESSSEANPSGVQGVCPNGWHVPSDAEWTQLTVYMNSQSEYACGGYTNKYAKALAATTGWNSSEFTCAVGNDLSANNATGFSALPAGYFTYYGGYEVSGYDASFWSTAEFSDAHAYFSYLYCDNSRMHTTYDGKCAGFSVRCVRD